MKIIAGLLLLASLAAPAQQPPPSRPRITGINHVGIRVTDAAAARHFYTQILGMSEPEARGSQLRFTVGRQHVVVHPGLPEGEDERLTHVAFETPDIAALATHLSARGVSISRPADRCHPSAIRVMDPDGHPIEFVPVTFPAAPAPEATGLALSNRLLHAGLIVGNEETAHKFYRDVLGFSEIWRGGRTDGVTSWINMRVPDGTDYLEYMLVTAPPDRRQRGTLHHICLRVPDIQTAWEAAALRSGRAARLSPPNVGRNGKWQLNLYDPDGTRVELMEPFTTR
ncbi:MAG TPA: VOC family protein [Vicinamibacterales bacterium]|nr:VOC family protein [Vicinamibacterales bacterium]